MTFATHIYAHDPKHESYGLEAAEALGLDPATVFKTLVADVDGKLTVAIVPVEHQLDLKALARGRRRQEGADGRRQARRAHDGLRRRRDHPAGPEEAARRPCSTTSALEHATIHVSGGRRGLEIELAPADLQRADARRRIARDQRRYDPSALRRMTSAASALVTNCGPVGISSPSRGKTP